MKKIIFLTISIFVFGLALPTSSFAQGMMGNMMGENNTVSQSDDGHTAREEAEGKEVWEKLQAKELACKDLSDDNFGALGEYFMGQMAGEQHEAMNNMMIQMMGEEGEEKMHVAMGKRMSGCDPNAQMPENMMPMMMGGGMMGSTSSPQVGGGGNSMIGNFGAWGWFGWIFMFSVWILIVVAIIALIKWLNKK